MKGVPIKFRAKPLIGDEFIFGDFVSRGDECAIRVKENNYLFNLHEYEIAVKPDSVAQLVGYDADGKEIYEGDELEASNPDYAAIIPCHKVLSPYDGKFSLKGLSDFDIATWNIRLKGDKK